MLFTYLTVLEPPQCWVWFGRIRSNDPVFPPVKPLSCINP